MKKLFNIFIFALLLLVFGGKAFAQEKVSVYYNEACSDCVVYIKNLEPILTQYNITPDFKDYINTKSYRSELNAVNKQYKIPLAFQDSLAVFLKPNLIIEGHVPLEAVRLLIANYESLPKHDLIILYQPEMHSNAKEYTLYVSGYDAQKVDVGFDIIADLKTKQIKAAETPEKNLLISVVIGALANSIHPCAIAVLLLLLSFLYAIRKNKKQILAIGLAYIFGIFIVYFLIGLGLLKAISLSDQPFFVAQIAAVILILLGLINVKDYFFPEFPIHLKIPDFTKGAIQRFLEQASVPTAFVVGALVGVCAFPCTGGIYTVIISTLAAAKSAKFLFYLFLYNLIFVLPLLIIVGISANKKLLDYVEKVELKNSRKMHLITGIFMILIGLGVYFWIGAIIYG